MEGRNNCETIRCGWLTEDPLYIKYHDEEWGKPVYDSIQLFEMLCLEGQQAGLSWLTVLKKRENYRQLFHNFNPYKISKLTDKDVKILLANPGIIRHAGKVEAIRHNSKCFINIESNGSFSDFIWSFVDYKPIINNWSNNKEIPSETKESIAMSKALKKSGFKFVGSTICYAFMQACGLVDDHIVNCICRKS